MASIRDPNWTGPGPGPFITVPDGTPGSVSEDTEIEDPGTTSTDGRGQFTAIERDAIDAAAGAARNYSGDEATAQYIRDLQAGKLGGGADTEAALSRLVEQGELRNLAARGDRNLFPGDRSVRPEDVAANPEDNKDTETKFDEDAFGRLKELLDRLGLGALTNNVRDLISKGILDNEAILFELRETSQYQERFIANKARKDKGLPELRPLTYVALEAQYRDTMRANGLNAELYDNQKDFRSLIEGDVSNAELQRRIVNGYKAVNEADPEVLRQMQELYNIEPGQLAQYFLDPDKTLPDLEKQASAAAIAARGKEQGKLQLGKLTAEDLVNRGYSETQALAAFKILGEQKGLYEEMSGETALTEGQKVGSVFGYDVDSAEGIKKRATSRKNVFLGGGKFAATTGSTSGTTQTGLGVAE